MFIHESSSSSSDSTLKRPIFQGKSRGHLTWIGGPMGSKKSIELIGYMERYDIGKWSVLGISHIFENRSLTGSGEREQFDFKKNKTHRYRVWNEHSLIYPHIKDIQGSIQSRSGIAYPCVQLETLMPFIMLPEVLANVDVFGIDEFQFFPDGLEAVAYLLNHHKIVITAGLDADFSADPFRLPTSYYAYTDLVAWAKDVIKLKAVCMQCSQFDAVFSERMSKKEELVVVGDTETYLAKCHNCYTHPTEKGCA